MWCFIVFNFLFFVSQEENEESCKSEKVESDNTSSSTSITSELLQILKLQAISSEDKLRVLDARDKLIRISELIIPQNIFKISVFSLSSTYLFVEFLFFLILHHLQDK